MEHIYYYGELAATAKKKVEEINKCWSDGPILKLTVKRFVRLKLICPLSIPKTRENVLLTIANFSII